ncbi:carbohydrate porin [Robbsia andropogonis]|uniref:carbohydrate porin n=2 Tax=Robbsia andropogonis TaxID=28092 RepID=UPI00069878E6|nr:carbohydrate porin [Robbsia andropogonis]
MKFYQPERLPRHKTKRLHAGAILLAAMSQCGTTHAQATSDTPAPTALSTVNAASSASSSDRAVATPRIKHDSVQGRMGSLTELATSKETVAAVDQAHVSRVGNVTPEPSATQRHGMLSGIGARMNDWGFTPIFNVVQMYLANPNMGEKTGNHEALTFFSIGADFDMQKIAGLKGATIHFQQVFVPFTTDLGWGLQAGDVLAGQPGPYVPKVSHLVRFTWEQKALRDQLDIEFGKSNPGADFGLPVCNQGFGCQSAILQKNAGMNPPIYSNWGGRVKYNLTPAWSVQAGVWRSNPAFPTTNGWEWTDAVTDSNTWLANIVYGTTYRTESYPKRYELLFYHNTATQTDPLTLRTHHGTSGMYLGGKQVVYRPDGGKRDLSDPTAVSIFGSLTTSFDAHASTGLATTGIGGVMVEAPLRSRPLDSYALSFLWATLTPNEQSYLKQENGAAGGGGYTVGRTQFGLKLDANIAVGRNIVLSPYAMRTWNTSTWGNPVYAGTPRNGYVAGILASVFLDRMLGLTEN